MNGAYYERVISTILEQNQARNWIANAACKGMDTKEFYPPRGDSVQVQKAKAFCRSQCLVREDCLEYALAMNETEGVWGGLSTKDRRGIRASWVRRACAEFAEAS